MVHSLWWWYGVLATTWHNLLWNIDQEDLTGSKWSNWTETILYPKRDQVQPPATRLHSYCAEGLSRHETSLSLVLLARCSLEAHCNIVAHSCRALMGISTEFNGYHESWVHNTKNAIPQHSTTASIESTLDLAIRNTYLWGWGECFLSHQHNHCCWVKEARLLTSAGLVEEATWWFVLEQKSRGCKAKHTYIWCKTLPN